jgi:hypothetical protein
VNIWHGERRQASALASRQATATRAKIFKASSQRTSQRRVREDATRRQEEGYFVADGDKYRSVIDKVCSQLGWPGLGA